MTFFGLSTIMIPVIFITFQQYFQNESGDHMLTLIKGGDLYASAPQGRRDILIGGGKILKIASDLDAHTPYGVEVIDARECYVFPGFLDAHVHILGGGGEGGYRSRTPEIMLSDIISGGVTTLVGCIGTDGTTRTVASLIAKARGLCEEGVTCFAYTGSYQIPVRTLTGSITDDLLLIDRILGCGEIAVSDHRSSQPTFEEFARVAADTRLGGILSGKAGIVNIHMGDGSAGLTYLRRLVRETEIPPQNLLPTHINRSGRLMAEGIDYALKDGGLIDLTTSSDPDFLEEDEVKASTGLRMALDAGVPARQITFSSDGQGSMPIFDRDRNYIGLGVGRVASLYREARDAYLKDGVPLETALLPITENPARILKLSGKGIVQEGADADLVLAGKDLNIRWVLAGGRVMIRDGKQTVFGTFETKAAAQKN